MKNDRVDRKVFRTQIRALLLGVSTFSAIVTGTVLFGSDFIYQTMICQPAAAVDGQSAATDFFCGKFEPIGGFFPKVINVRRLEIAKEGNEYRLIGTKMYDKYRFVKTEDGILQDKEKILGKIHMGTATFKGSDVKLRILKAEFCYNNFLLIPIDGPSRWIVPQK